MNAQQLSTQINQLPEVTRNSLAIQIKLMAAALRARDASEAAAKAQQLKKTA